jgi:LPS sulfotransferase NodH
MLGHALHKTSSFGFPLEYTNPANLAKWKKRFGISGFQEVMTEIQRNRTSPNGVFGIKIHYSHIEQFGGFKNLIKLFPDAYYILLSRKDVLNQAVSLSIASKTGVWISGQKAMNDNPTYDYEHIDKCLRQTILDNSSWRYILAASGCNYIEMDFDEVCNDLVQSIERIAQFTDIEVDPETIPEEQVTKKQSKDLNKEWAIKYTTDFNKSEELLRNKGPGAFQKFKRNIKRVIRA